MPISSGFMKKKEKNTVYFKETQPVSRFWIRLLLLFEVIFFSAMIYRQLFMGRPFGPRPVTDTGLVVLSLLLTLPVVVLFFMKVRIKVDNREIQYKMEPLGIFKYHIEKQKLKSFSLETRKAGSAHPVPGILFQLKDGKTLFLPTKNAEQFYRAVEKMVKAG